MQLLLFPPEVRLQFFVSNNGSDHVLTTSFSVREGMSVEVPLTANPDLVDDLLFVVVGLFQGLVENTQALFGRLNHVHEDRMRVPCRLTVSEECLGFPGAHMVKNPPAVLETCVRSRAWEDPLEKGMAAHSSILAQSIPMDRGPQRVRRF